MIGKSLKSEPFDLGARIDECDEIMSTIFQDTIITEPDAVDSRRRLEDRLEEVRLRREILDFDFDLDG